MRSMSQHMSRAYDNYRRIRKLPFNQNSRTLFLEFLGYYPMNPGDAYPDSVAKKIMWLASNDAELMYRIWEIQHDG